MRKTIFSIFFLVAFFGLTKSTLAAWPDSELVSSPDTIHTYTNTYNGADQGTSNGYLTYDSNSSTFMGNSGGAQGNTSVVIAQHAFLYPATINSIQYRISAGGHCGGSYDKSANYNIYIQYRVGGVWYYLPGSQFSGGVGDGSIGYDTGYITYTPPAPITNVTGIQTYAYGQGHGEDRASNGSYAYIYETQVWGNNYIDIGLRIYDGTSIVKIAIEPAATLYSRLRIVKNGIVYAVALVPILDPNGSKIRIRTATVGTYALRKF